MISNQNNTESKSDNHIDINLNKQVFTLPEAALYLSISKSALYKMNMDSIIPFYKPRRKVYYKRSDLDNYLFSNKNENLDQDFDVTSLFNKRKNGK